MDNKKELYLVLYFNEPLGKLQLGTRAKFFIFLRDLLERSEGLCLNLYFSGFILEWMEDEDRDFIKRLLPHIDAGSIEILAGGFYEPNYSQLSVKSCVRQVRQSLDFYESRLNYRPENLFIPRMLWSESLPEIAGQTGVSGIAVADEGYDGEKDVFTSSEGLNLFRFDLAKSRQLFLEGPDMLSKLVELESPQLLALPAELFTNRVGSEWLFNLLDELKNTKFQLKRLVDRRESGAEWPVMKEADLSECLWLDTVYNYPYFYFFINDIAREKKLDITGTYSDYTNDVSEIGQMMSLLSEAEEMAGPDCPDKALSVLSSLEFYGYTWPGCFGGLIYTALRQNFFREYLQYLEFAGKKTEGVQVDDCGNSTALRSNIFNIVFNNRSGNIERLDFIPKKCTLINCRKNYRDVLEWRKQIYGELEEEQMPDNLNFNEEPSMLAETVSLGEASPLFLHSMDLRHDTRRNICHLDFIKQFGEEGNSVRLVRAVSLRETNNNIFFTYSLETDKAEVIECHLSTGFYLGLSHPGYSRSFVRITAGQENRDLGFENSEKLEGVEKVQVFDGLLGVEVDFLLDDAARVSIRPDYVADRLPEQYQLMFQGLRMDLSWKKSISKEKANNISFGIRVKQYA